MPPIKFCASPWIELVLSIEGVSRPCCRSGVNLGNWRELGIAAVWASDPAVTLRRKILEGKFPDQACQFCFENNTHANLRKLLFKALQSFCIQLKPINSHGMMRLANLQILFDKTEMDAEGREILKHFNSVLDSHDTAARASKNADHAMLARKLRVMGQIVEDFLLGSLLPRHIGPVRQPNLIAICNARCVHCNGNFTGQIKDGILLDSGERIPYLSEEECLRTLAEIDGIVDFFMNGSEFLFYRHWKTVVTELAIKNKVKIRISTNGMLLTPEVSDFLLENDCVGKLNVSLDGGTGETISKVRGRVKFEVVRENILHFLKRNVSTCRNIPTSLSFVLCSYNYKELKDIVELAHSLAHQAGAVPPHVLVQAMATQGHRNYGKWLDQHHHSRLDRDDVVCSFHAMADVAREKGITVVVFYRYTLEEFIGLGCPLPEYHFLETCLQY